jgi:dTDP-4-amino-4,6-dideoxygalactose transaminase
MKEKIKLFDPVFGKEEEQMLLNALRSKFWASGAGSGNVKKFEEQFKKYIDAKSCIAVNNGTAALHLALSLFDVKGKEVILPSLSFVSTAHAILYNGGKPVFVDVDPNTLCIDHTQIEEHITSKTKAILPVHFAGFACNLESIKKTGKKHGISIIEDAAHASGTIYKNKKIGSHGDAVCFSFHPVKNLAMPTGGAITLNGKETSTYEKALKIRRWCGISNRHGSSYDITELGWNFYMNEFSAAIGIEQLKKLDLLNKKRKKIAKRYHDEVELAQKMPYDNGCSYHFYWICVKNREEFMEKMNSVGIETGIHYRPIHTMSMYQKYKPHLPSTTKIGKCVVSLPTHPNLTDGDITRVINNVNKFGNS